MAVISVLLLRSNKTDIVAICYLVRWTNRCYAPSCDGSHNVTCKQKCKNWQMRNTYLALVILYQP